MGSSVKLASQHFPEILFSGAHTPCNLLAYCSNFNFVLERTSTSPGTPVPLSSLDVLRHLRASLESLVKLPSDCEVKSEAGVVIENSDRIVRMRLLPNNIRELRCCKRWVGSPEEKQKEGSDGSHRVFELWSCLVVLAHPQLEKFSKIVGVPWCVSLRFPTRASTSFALEEGSKEPRREKPISNFGAFSSARTLPFLIWNADTIYPDILTQPLLREVFKFMPRFSEMLHAVNVARSSTGLNPSQVGSGAQPVLLLLETPFHASALYPHECVPDLPGTKEWMDVEEYKLKVRDLAIRSEDASLSILKFFSKQQRDGSPKDRSRSFGTVVSSQFSIGEGSFMDESSDSSNSSDQPQVEERSTSSSASSSPLSESPLASSKKDVGSEGLTKLGKKYKLKSKTRLGHDDQVETTSPPQKAVDSADDAKKIESVDDVVSAVQSHLEEEALQSLVHMRSEQESSSHLTAQKKTRTARRVKTKRRSYGPVERPGQATDETGGLPAKRSRVECC
mmetsp:Transcript_22453/g.72278  ORF Transcript_22453/g.72278 Transcript_22453/m.72278 type:complete len:506 (-) Transcript_22453:33-1550(-)